MSTAKARQRFMSTTPTPPPPQPPRPSPGTTNATQHVSNHPIWVRAFAKFANGKQPGQQGFWLEVAIIFTVFAVTGSSSLMVVRKGINQALGVEGSLKDGPNSWRLAYVVFGLPMYSAILLTLGTLSGRGAYFRMMTLRMYGRILPKSWADKLKV
ncbi:hypothetical protein BCR44DRAFT_125739 [Catenaria anguillulae PL171]|uniref:DUF6787 domain-containing protein n=1 Tax=Catenaria anguillulae PL171 TaxID=765915 RepID=A0A1Y2HKP0_9FUNG|nr:hypothetical protein BCR44DRAFT_125739 [Catenaria anguillulae PL171]